MTPMAFVLTAIGGAMFFEGILWAVFPGGVRRLYNQVMAQMPDRDLHLSGLISVFIGVILMSLAVKIAS